MTLQLLFQGNDLLTWEILVPGTSPRGRTLECQVFRLKLKALAENFGAFYVSNEPGLVLGPDTDSRQCTRLLVLHSTIEITSSL